MGDEFVTVLAGGMEWSAFERIQVQAGHDEAARSFRIDIAAEPGPFATVGAFSAGTLIDIRSNGTLMCRGYVDRFQPSMNGHKDAKIAISGRSKGQDAIDSSAVHTKGGRFKKKTVLQIANELDQFGIGYSSDEQLDQIPHYQIAMGETVHRALEHLCRAQGLTMSGQPDGSVKITKGGKQTHITALVEGENILSADADHNWSNRHSEVIVRGQRPWGHGPDALEIEATVRDAAIQRYRPVVIVSDDDTDRKRADKRAKNRRNREAGNSLKANVVVQGFRDGAGLLWTPGNLVFVDSPFLAITQMMLIETARYTQDRKGGSETALSLVDPRAYDAGKGGKTKGGSSGDGWKVDPKGGSDEYDSDGLFKTSMAVG